MRVISHASTMIIKKIVYIFSLFFCYVVANEQIFVHPYNYSYFLNWKQFNSIVDRIFCSYKQVNMYQFLTPNFLEL